MRRKPLATAAGKPCVALHRQMIWLIGNGQRQVTLTAALELLYKQDSEYGDD